MNLDQEMAKKSPQKEIELVDEVEDDEDGDFQDEGSEDEDDVSVVDENEEEA